MRFTHIFVSAYYLWDTRFTKSVNFVKFLRTPYLQNTSRRLRLSISSANKIHNYLHNIITTNIYTILLEVLYCQHWSPLCSCFLNNGRSPVGKQSLLNTDIFPR